MSINFHFSTLIICVRPFDMQDEVMESMKNYCHLQRTPSLSVRDKDMVWLSTGRVPWRTVKTIHVPVSSTSEDHSCHKHLLCDGTAEDAHWSFLSEDALEDNTYHVYFQPESSSL